MDPEQKEKRWILIWKMLAFSGWALAFFSLFIAGTLLNRYHLEIVEMQQENKRLKISLERAQFIHTQSVERGQTAK